MSLRDAYIAGQMQAAEEIGLEKQAFVGKLWGGIKAVGRGAHWLGSQAGLVGNKVRAVNTGATGSNAWRPGMKTFTDQKSGQLMSSTPGWWTRKSALGKAAYGAGTVATAGAYGTGKLLERYNQAAALPSQRLGLSPQQTNTGYMGYHNF